MLKDPQQSQLFYRIGGRKPDKSGKFRTVRELSCAASAVLERLGGKGKSHLVQLWHNWGMAMGAEIAAYAIPLGSRNSTLLIGGENNMALQELSYLVPEILERANAFMGTEHFDKVELHLLLGKTALNARISGADIPTTVPRNPLPPRPRKLGSLLHLLDPESSVGRCYAAYVRMYDPKDS